MLEAWQMGYQFKMQCVLMQHIKLLYSQHLTQTLKMMNPQNRDSGKKAEAALGIWEETPLSENLMESDWQSPAGAATALPPNMENLAGGWENLLPTSWFRNPRSLSARAQGSHSAVKVKK